MKKTNDEEREKEALRYAVRHPLKFARVVRSAFFNPRELINTAMNVAFVVVAANMILYGAVKGIESIGYDSSQWTQRKDGSTNIVERFHGGVYRIYDTNGDGTADMWYKAVPRAGFTEDMLASSLDQKILENTTRK